MKQIATILFLILFCVEAKSQDRILCGGTLSEDIVILNRRTQEVEWRYGGIEGECKECNSLMRLKGDKIVYTCKKRATMINMQGETIWNFFVREDEELQSVSRGRKGGLILAIAGHPMRIVEIDINGNVKNEITYDTGVENIHKQFRQIAVTKRGGYIIPISTLRKLVELNSMGEVVKAVELEESPLYATITRKGNWIVTCGHSGYIYEIDGKSGGKRLISSSKKLSNGANIEFGAGVVELKNRNLLLANWLGHNGDKSQPMLLEINKDGDVVWQMNQVDGFTFAAGIDVIY